MGLSKTMTKIAAANESTAGKQDTKIEIIRRTPTGNTVTRAEPTTPLEAEISFASAFLTQLSDDAKALHSKDRLGRSFEERYASSTSEVHSGRRRYAEARFRIERPA